MPSQNLAGRFAIGPCPLSCPVVPQVTQASKSEVRALSMELTQTRAQCEGLARELAGAAQARDTLAGQLEQQLALAEAEVRGEESRAVGSMATLRSWHCLLLCLCNSVTRRQLVD